MLKKMKNATFKKLQKVHGDDLLTVYTPLQVGFTGHKYNQSQLHNLRSELKKILPEEQHKTMFREIENTLNAIGYDNKQHGLVMFYDDKVFKSYTLNFEPISGMIRSNKYELDQIAEYFRANKPYYVLAISKKGTLLYKGDMESLVPVEVSGLGQDLSTTLRIDDINSSNVQNHQVSAGGKDGVGFHGHGGYKDIKKVLFEDYLRFIDKKILSTIKDKSIPLVLVAVEYGQSAYKLISKYPTIFSKGVLTNPDELSAVQLHNKTLPLISGT
jgi:hypothetical protein